MFDGEANERKIQYDKQKKEKIVKECDRISPAQ